MRDYLFAAACASALVPPAAAQHGGSPPPQPVVEPRQTSDPYRPFEFLVGDWVSQQGSSTLRQSIRWGAQRAYMIYSTYMQQPGSAERLHFEGMMVWNGKSRKLDFLFAVEPGSWILERGTLHAETDGTIVRDTDLISPTGVVSVFRQTFSRIDADHATTSLMAQRNGQWEPTFPGSERIEMRRSR
jgi:hypothetical protein